VRVIGALLGLTGLLGVALGAEPLDKVLLRMDLEARGFGQMTAKFRNTTYTQVLDDLSAEVGSLCVMQFYQNRGVGKKMVEYACLQAKERGVTTIVALSTQSFGFFINTCGFEEKDKSVLPEARLKLYDESGRNAKVLVKPLA